MRAIEYLEHFEPTRLNPELTDDLSKSYQAMSEEAERFLRSVYESNFPLVAVTGETQAIIDVATNARKDHLTNTSRARMPLLQQMNAFFIQPDDNPQVAANKEVRLLQFGATWLANIAIADAVNSAVKNTQRKKPLPTFEPIQGALNKLTNNLAHELYPPVTIKHSTVNYRKDRLGESVDHYRPGSLIVPQAPWLAKAQSKTKELITLCSSLHEIDVFFAALEWIKKTKLPAVPIIAPMATEQGRQIGEHKQNMHADVLICRIDEPSIYPLQAKSTHQFESRLEYDERVLVIDPFDIGTADSESRVVKRENGNTTSDGHEVQFVYGAFWTNWIRVYRNPNRNKKTISALHERMSKAFQYFDEHMILGLTA